MNVVLPTAGSVGSVFAIPRDDWSKIQNRVAVMLQGQPEELAPYIPNIEALVSVCQRWQSETFPGLLSQAVDTNQFATRAAQTLTDLSTELKPLKPDDPLPHSITFIFNVQFAALRDMAVQHAATVDALTPQINAFVAENRAADAALEQLLGEVVEAAFSSLEDALSEVQGGWSQIATELGAAASSQVTLTTADLLALDVQSAIASWQQTAADAAAFVNTVPAPTASS